jgi:hypothetical protein
MRSKTTLALVPTYAGECRLIRGFLVGDATADLDLWDFCGELNLQEPRPRKAV